MTSSVSAVKRELPPFSQESVVDIGEACPETSGQRVATLVWDDGVGYESRSTAARDRMSGTKVCVTIGQPWVAGEGEGVGAEPSQHTKMETGRGANVHVVHHTNVQDQAGTETETERDRNKGRQKENGKNKGGENRWREKVKMCQVAKIKKKQIGVIKTSQQFQSKGKLQHHQTMTGWGGERKMIRLAKEKRLEEERGAAVAAV